MNSGFWYSCLRSQHRASRCSRIISFPYVFHELFRAFTHSVMFSSGSSSLKSSFFNRIVNVILLCSKKQMIGITAGRIVTVMTNKQSFRNITKPLFPNKSSSRNQFPIENESPVTSSFGGNPIPARTFRSYLHFKPKSIVDKPLFRMFSCPNNSTDLQGSTGLLVSFTIFLHNSVYLIVPRSWPAKAQGHFHFLQTRLMCQHSF